MLWDERQLTPTEADGQLRKPSDSWSAEAVAGASKTSGSSNFYCGHLQCSQQKIGEADMKIPHRRLQRKFYMWPYLSKTIRVCIYEKFY
jgi:hypothetical protein